LDANGAYPSFSVAIEYDIPEPGKYRWNVVRIVKDTAPEPGTPGHDDSFPVKNSEKYSVSFMEHIHFAVTETDVDPLTNDYADILYTHYDFDEDQVWAKNAYLDQGWATSGCNPVPTRVGDASIVYNCFAYALGYTDRAINDIKYFTNPSYFSSRIPDWRSLEALEKPDRAGHGKKYEEHASIVTQETRTFTLGGFTFSMEINVYTGKYGEFGIYKSDGEEASEYDVALAQTKNYKQK
jgi:hypothetical protein